MTGDYGSHLQAPRLCLGALQDQDQWSVMPGMWLRTPSGLVADPLSCSARHIRRAVVPVDPLVQPDGNQDRATES